MNSKTLSTRTCLLLILLFGIAAYSNTFNSPFCFDDSNAITRNQSLLPPLNLKNIWRFLPARFLTNLSFALQYSFTGLAPWGFHIVNLIIHLLASMVVFALTRMLLRTPALREAIPPSHHDLFALAPALLFLAHPVQTQAVTYIVQRATSLATLFYLTTLWLYLKARLEDARHNRLVFIFMLAAMFTKEISLTLPFTILLMDFCFFPISNEETVPKKIRRWLPFAAFLFIIPLLRTTFEEHPIQLGGTMGILPMEDTNISHKDYLLTEFRVLRTYLKLLVFPVNQCLDYDYRLSSGWGDPDTWAAFSLLFSLFLLALAFVKKYRLLAFGIFWFFLTLSVESSLLPIRDVIFEHRLYLPIFGLSIFFSFLLWKWCRSPSRFLAVLLVIAVTLSAMTYARNEMWKSSITLWGDTVKKAPHKWRPYCQLGEAYTMELNDDKTALLYYHKALESGAYTTAMITSMAAAYSRLGNSKEWTHYKNWADSMSSKNSTAQNPPDRMTQLVLYANEAIVLEKEKKIPEAINAMKKAIEVDSRFSPALVLLGNLYRKSGQDDAAIASFRKAIEAAPSSQEGYNALALLYKKKGEDQKALAVMVEYLKFKQKHKPLLGD